MIAAVRTCNKSWAKAADSALVFTLSNANRAICKGSVSSKQGRRFFCFFLRGERTALGPEKQQTNAPSPSPAISLLPQLAFSRHTHYPYMNPHKAHASCLGLGRNSKAKVVSEPKLTPTPTPTLSSPPSLLHYTTRKICASGGDRPRQRHQRPRRSTYRARGTFRPGVFGLLPPRRPSGPRRGGGDREGGAAVPVGEQTMFAGSSGGAILSVVSCSGVPYSVVEREANRLADYCAAHNDCGPDARRRAAAHARKRARRRAVDGRRSTVDGRRSDPAASPRPSSAVPARRL